MPDIEITADPNADRLSGAFDGDDSSFTETMTGIVADIGDKFKGKGKSKRKNKSKNKAEKPKPAPKPEAAPTPMSLESGDSGSPGFLNPKVLGIGAVAVMALIAGGWWFYNGSGETVPPTPADATTAGSVTEADPVFERAQPAQDSGIDIDELLDEARAARDAGQLFNPPGSNAIELYVAVATAAPGNSTVADELAAVINETLTQAESAMLERRSADAAAALDRVALADPQNSRLPFLTAQLSQMQLREYLDSARAAIRDGRFEDAAGALSGARGLNVSDATEINAVAQELQHGTQRTTGGRCAGTRSGPPRSRHAGFAIQ